MISSGSSLDTSFVKLNTLKAKLAPSLALYADVILRPTFPAHELERLKKMQIAGIQQEKAQAFGISRRLYTRLLYGAATPYANQTRGSEIGRSPCGERGYTVGWIQGVGG